MVRLRPGVRLIHNPASFKVARRQRAGNRLSYQSGSVRDLSFGEKGFDAEKTKLPIPTRVLLEISRLACSNFESLLKRS